MSGSETYRARLYRDYEASKDPALRADEGRELGLDEDGALERNILPLLPVDRAARILDVGCGRGELLSFLKRRGYSAVSGVDRSPETVRRAKARGLDVIEGDLGAHLGSHAGTYDCIAAIDVLEHLHKDEVLAFLDRAAAALKPGGSLVALTVNADGPFAARMQAIDFTHETAFTRHSLGQVFRAAGLTRAEFHPLGPAGRGPRACLRRVLWRFARLAMGLYYHVEHGSGILRNDHILTANLVARAFKE